MTRNITTELDLEMSKREVHPVIFMHGEFVGGDVRLTSLPFNIEWNNWEWIGSGRLVSLDAVEDSTDLSSKGQKVTLSNIPLDLIGVALNEPIPQSPGRLWIGALDAETKLIIPDPLLVFSGRLDQSAVVDDTQDGRIELTYQSAFFNPEGIKAWRYSNESHESFTTGFTGGDGDQTFRFVEQLADLREHIPWGRAR